MNAVDTNILLRFFTRDDPAQHAEVRSLLAHTEAAGDRLFVSVLALAETLWTLRTQYRWNDVRCRAALREIADMAAFTLDHASAVASALNDPRLQRLDVADALIASIGMEAGCDSTLTFDKAAARSSNQFELL
ncbi:MAG: type II toxin-antitoxin system VapC family toxin [Pacificimonas sp.]|nr:type II toxin-antitoxin system VapC family toxin [Pacificimonas sp.]